MKSAEFHPRSASALRAWSRRRAPITRHTGQRSSPSQPRSAFTRSRYIAIGNFRVASFFTVACCAACTSGKTLSSALCAVAGFTGRALVFLGGVAFFFAGGAAEGSDGAVDILAEAGIAMDSDGKRSTENANVFAFDIMYRSTSKKRFVSYAEASRRLKDGAPVTTRAGSSIDVERSKPVHAVFSFLSST